MSRIFAASLLFILVCSVACGQTSANTPAPGPTGNDSTSQQSQPTTIPDNAPPAASDKKKSAVTRKLDQLKPDCINLIVYHPCWSSTPPPEPKPAPKGVDPEYAKDMDVGNFYLNERKNYMGAMMRFRDALTRKPNDPEATFKLAQSLEGLGQIDEAREQYQAYLNLQPDGQFTSQANKAVERLQGKGAVGKSKQATPDSHPR